MSSLCSAQSEFSSAARPFRAHHIYARRIHLSCISKSFCKQGCANAKARFCWREKLFYLAFLGELSPAKCQDSGRHRPSKRFQRSLRRFLPLFAPFKGSHTFMRANSLFPHMPFGILRAKTKIAISVFARNYFNKSLARSKIAILD